jgi:hypothetical protein
MKVIYLIYNIYTYTYIYYIFKWKLMFFFFLAVLGFELRVSCLQSHASSPFCSGYLEMGSPELFVQGASNHDPPDLCLPSSQVWATSSWLQILIWHQHTVIYFINSPMLLRIVCSKCGPITLTLIRSFMYYNFKQYSKIVKSIILNKNRVDDYYLYVNFGRHIITAPIHIRSSAVNIWTKLVQLHSLFSKNLKLEQWEIFTNVNWSGIHCLPILCKIFVL